MGWKCVISKERCIAVVCTAAIWGFLVAMPLFGQQAEVSGIVRDESGGVISKASVDIRNAATNVVQTVRSDESGIYRLPPVSPGRYSLNVSAPGFETKSIENLQLDIGSKQVVDVELAVGNVSQTVTVDGSGVQINTVNATVSTVVDRQFVENIPLNGKSFQSLMTMAPGVTAVPSKGTNQGGEISVNGQRTEANYFTVDGVSANSGAAAAVPGYGAGYSGSLAGQTILGTTQSLVSIDALQEFRATTSTYSAEYGRTPGGQFSFLTRSGTNLFHGSLFDYFRNDVLDANNWFNNRSALPKNRERQNNFGGTFGGPVLLPKIYDGKDRTFFFFSYEGLRLRSPQAAILTEVPDVAMRQAATTPAVRALLNAFPLPNGAERGDGLAYFTAGYSSPSSLDTYSLRVDHRFNDKFSVFGRWSDSPSEAITRPSANLAQVTTTNGSVRTLTLGATKIFSPRISNDFRINRTWNTTEGRHTVDGFGGAVPLSPDELGQLMPGMGGNNWLFFYLWDMYPAIRFFPQINQQRQWNITDAADMTFGRHTLKLGIDYRQLITETPLASVYESGNFSSFSGVANNTPGTPSIYSAGITMKPIYKNFSAYAQDEWRVNSRLSLSLGLRWDVNPAPRDADGNQPYTITTTDLLTTKLAPRGTPLWNTTWNNFAPRTGIAYQIRKASGYETVLRAGTGLFFDTGNNEASRGYWYATGVSQRTLFPGSQFPLTQEQVDSLPPPSTTPPYQTLVIGFDPNLKLPYTWQWNVTVEQALGSHQTLTAGYLGSASRRQTVQRQYMPDQVGNLNFGPLFGLYLIDNGGSSDYDALQVQYQRRLSRGLQGMMSYTWSHGLDNATINFQVYQLTRGNSDYDIRHNFQLAATYDVPGSYNNRVVRALLSHWSFDMRFFVRSALPVDVLGGSRVDAATGGSIQFHPNYIFGQPLYVDDANSPGRCRINFNAFGTAAANQEGNLGRNVLRGFGATQADITLRRSFPIGERATFQVRAEAFNLANHANFGTIYNQLTNGATLFGTASNTLNGQLGGLNSLYQIGGPRSMQLALRLQF